MRENEKKFLELAERGVFKIYRNGNVYKCKRKIQCKDEYKNIKPKLRNRPGNNGYVLIGFRYKGKIKYILAHRAVWVCFNGDISKELEINHINGIRDNNRLSNLELVTSSENDLHAYNVLGRIPIRGEEVGNSKLTNKKVLKIRKLLKEGVLQYVIAKMFDVANITISNINTGRTWSHVV